MANHSNATARRETLHVNLTSRTSTIVNALKQRARAVLNDRSIDAQSRAIIRYALETNDPWLAELVRRADAGESVVDNLSVVETSQGEDSSEDKIEALTELICRAGDEAETKSAALLVLLSTLENATHPKTLANMAKHVAFTRCGELNAYGMVDAQIFAVEGELFVADTLQR